MSLDTLLALSEPWFPHLQNEDRFGIGPCHPGVSVSLMTQEPERLGKGERIDEVHRSQAEEGSQEEGGDSY